MRSSLKADELLKLIDILNSNDEAGRLTLIVRMGDAKIDSHFPHLLKRVRSEGRKVVWVCDPMHGNTITAPNGYKTRRFADVLGETRKFFDIHKSEGTHASGVMFELTGKDVQECTGGDQEITDAHLAEGLYETLCDPRLNASQALELAFQLCK